MAVANERASGLETLCCLVGCWICLLMLYGSWNGNPWKAFMKRRIDLSDPATRQQLNLPALK